MNKTISAEKIDINKKILFYFIILIFLYLTSEMLAFLTHFILKKEIFSWATYQTIRKEIIEPSTSTMVEESGIFYDGKGVQVLHPYLGTVSTPKPAVNPKANWVSEYGFRGEGLMPPLSPKTNNNVIVGIFGGSFAAGTSLKAKNVLREYLQRLPQYQNKEFLIHTIAWGGYKQPQQLLALAYFLSLGGYFDIVINLDGFNEVVLPAVENVPKQVFPFFPRDWFGKVYTFRDSSMLAMIGKIAFFTEKQKDWAKLFIQTPLRYSILSNLVWDYYNNLLNNQIVNYEIEFTQYKIPKMTKLSYLVTRPTFHYANDNELSQDLATMWRRSSIQMYNLCFQNGSQYFHFLQPNQYVVNSKILSREELQTAFQSDHIYKKWVELGYPYLIKEGEYIKQQGIRYYNLSMIFANNTEPLYVDTCCHLNEKGSEIIAETIGKILLQEIK